MASTSKVSSVASDAELLPVETELRPLKIVLVIQNMGVGGAERVLANLANYWAERGRTVTIFAFQSPEREVFFPLNPAIKYRGLDMAQIAKNLFDGILNNIRRFRKLRKVIAAEKPDVVISFLAKINMVTLLATIGFKCKIFVTEHTEPGNLRKHKKWFLMRPLIYRLADRVILLSKDMLKHFPAAVKRKTGVIPNPVPAMTEPLGKEFFDNKVPSKVLIAAGRLEECKGYDFLLQAFSKIHKNFPEWSVQFWGDGTLKDNLVQQKEALGLSECVSFHQPTKDIYAVMRKADIFLLSSRYEGFPNVLLEAMINGLPIITFDCVASIREILSDGVEGIIVPPEDVNAFARAMADLMSDDDKRMAMARKGPKAVEKYSMDNVMKIWEREFEEFVFQKPPKLRR